jgi:putative salt-induced outer membrane protein YdiY
MRAPGSSLGALFSRKLAKLCAAIAIAGCLLAIPLLAQAESSDETAVQPLWSGAWRPPEPNHAGWDWVRLKSNEWVKGEIILMRDFDLQFDSDKFGVVDLNWEDVDEILTERVYVFVLQDMTTSHTGTMAMRGDEISVRAGDEIETFDRSQLLAITPSGDRETNLWSMHASFGIGLRSGNTESAEYTGRMRLNREAKRTQFKFNCDGIYGSLDNEKNTNNHRGSSQFNYFLTRDLFLTPAAFEVFSDEFQNVSYRLTPTVGIGYYLVRRPKVEWDTWFGAGYQHTRLDSAPQGDSTTADNGAIILSTSFDADLSSTVDLVIEYQLQLITPDIELTNHHSEVTLEIELTSAIDLDLTFIWDRIEDPETESDGSTPDTDDLRLSARPGHRVLI